MRNIKNHFKLNGQTYDELEETDKRRLDRMFSLLQGIESFLEDRHYINFNVNKNDHMSFDTNFPQKLTPKIMEAFVLSKS